MKCKKSIMGFAALLIVIFHFWITLTPSPIEATIYKSAYLGVDLFFFVSAYSLGLKKEISYGRFILNRVLFIYLPFVVLSAIYALYKGLPIDKFGQIICGAEFFSKGGGAFLWFAIAIMILYLVAPLLVLLKNRLGWKALPIMLALWAGLAILLEYVFHVKTLFILVNRLPIFFLGMYYGEIRKLRLGRMKLPLILLGLAAGGFLTSQYASTVRISKPITDMYYLVIIPLVVSIVALFDYIAERTTMKNVPLAFVGGFTLELYGLQMIFGFDIEMTLLKSLMKSSMPRWTSSLLAFVLTMLALILMAFVFKLLKDLITRFIKKIKNNGKKKES